MNRSPLFPSSPHKISPLSLPSSRAAALNGISEFLTSDDCHLRSLCLADSHLRDGSAIVLEALAENRSLTTLNIRSGTLLPQFPHHHPSLCLPPPPLLIKLSLLPNTHTLTHTLPHSPLTHTLPPSLTPHSLTPSLTPHSLPHSLTHSLTPSLTPPSLPHSLTPSLTVVMGWVTMVPGDWQRLYSPIAL